MLPFSSYLTILPGLTTGTHKAGLPLQLSNDIYELRTKEPRHSHAFSGIGKYL